MEIAQRIIPYIISGAWKFDYPEERLRQRMGDSQVYIWQSHFLLQKSEAIAESTKRGFRDTKSG
jgi:hypothetical protein